MPLEGKHSGAVGWTR